MTKTMGHATGPNVMYFETGQGSALSADAHRTKAGLSDDLKFHGLRHTFVTNLLLLGYAPFFVMAQAGHADLQTTLGYAHFADALVSRRKRAEFKQRLVAFGYALPEGVAVERDNPAIARWVAEVWPRIKKRRGTSGRTSS